MSEYSLEQIDGMYVDGDTDDDFGATQRESDKVEELSLQGF
jgi:hypothetical protein